MEGKTQRSKLLRNMKAEEQICIELKEQSHNFALNKEYAARGELVITQSGHKAELEINIQNLNAEKAPFKLFLIGRKDGCSVYRVMNDIVPDCHGNARLHKTFNPADVDGNGTDLSCFYIFMIAAAGKPLQPVMKGDIVKITEKKEQMDRKSGYDYSKYYMEYIKNKTALLIEDYSGYDEILPFDNEWLCSRWKRVDEVMKLPVASVGAEIQTGKYGHFIFAYTDEHFYLAIPGKHTEEEWPDRGRSGFVMWQSIRDSEEYGYWCMVIDIKTGFITEIS